MAKQATESILQDQKKCTKCISTAAKGNMGTAVTKSNIGNG